MKGCRGRTLFITCVCSGRQNVGVFQQNHRLVQKPLLEGGDGVNVSGSTKLREDHIRQRDSGERLLIPVQGVGTLISASLDKHLFAMA